MKFLLYAKVDHNSIEKQLGIAEYSYFFLLRAFAGVLAELGEVVQLQDPGQADLIYSQCLADGEKCVLLSFTPPHKCPVTLHCPTVPVFAWEYPDIPERIQEQSWLDDPRNDWRLVLAHTGRAITLSSHTADAVRRSMGQGYPIVTIPSPIAAIASRDIEARTPAAPSGTLLRLDISLADSRCMGLNVDGLICLEEEDGTPFKEDDNDVLPPRGSASSETAVSGPLAQGDDEPCPADESEPAICGWDLPARARVRTRLHGVVYTSVLTPSSGRKNWEDLITAFCWAFRDTADATLILKLTGTDLKKHHHQLLMLLTKLSPFKCRVITLNGYLSDADYGALVEATTYYVNASLCEGLCLPLVEFLGEGIPALAPDNTAMADYIKDDLAFVVASYPGVPTVWPHGDNEVNRTSYHQIDWQSLMLAYRRSHHVAMHDPGHYQRMSRRAREAMQEYCSTAVVTSQLHAFLCPTLPSPAPSSTNISAALQAPLSVDS